MTGLPFGTVLVVSSLLARSTGSAAEADGRPGQLLSAATSTVGLSYHQRQGISPHSRQMRPGLTTGALELPWVPL